MRDSCSILVVLAAGLSCGNSLASPFVTDFKMLDGAARATGVWRNDATGQDLGVRVSLWQAGGEIMGVGAPDPSVLDNTFSWMDAPPIDLFEPNFTGDLINVAIPGGEICDLFVNFHGVVENPVISVRGIGPDTVLYVGDPFTVVAMAPNMVATGRYVTSDGTPVIPVGEETSGSLRVDGSYTGLRLTVANFRGDPVLDRDEVGFIFSAPAAPAPAGQLSIETVGTNVVLSWPDTATFSAIEAATDLEPGSWEELSGADPATSTSYVVPLGTLGETLYFRGVYAD